ncbi:hypothetical protein J6590_001883 [Homalodisca vitripennis]|nr:hypothetical protein J6590_001883 [Homalodisca vitripennis]
MEIRGGGCRCRMSDKSRISLHSSLSNFPWPGRAGGVGGGRVSSPRYIIQTGEIDVSNYVNSGRIKDVHYQIDTPAYVAPDLSKVASLKLGYPWGCIL